MLYFAASIVTAVDEGGIVLPADEVLEDLDELELGPEDDEDAAVAALDEPVDLDLED